MTRAPALSISASLRLPLVERWLRELKPESVLEAGCGLGAMGYRLSGRYDYRGYEPDPVSFAIAAERVNGRGEVVEGEVPLVPDRRFDLVVAFEVLEHIEDDLDALIGWAGWLTPGGHVMVSVPAHPQRFGPCDEAVGHCRRYTRESLERLFRSAGCEVVAVESWGMPVGYALEAIRNRLAARRHDPVGTPGSGRLHQPPSRLGQAVEWAVWPLAALQAPFRATDRGIGFVAVGRLSNRAV